MTVSGASKQTTVLVTDRRENAEIGDGGYVPLTRHHEVVFAVMTPFAQAGVRAIRTFLQALVAFLPLLLAGKPLLASVGVMVPAGDFLDALSTAAGLAVAPAAISLLQNLIEIFAKLDEAFPKARA